MPSKPANPKSFRISLPATSANLGPAFDAAALAMDFYIHIAARPAKEFPSPPPAATKKSAATSKTT